MPSRSGRSLTTAPAKPTSEFTLSAGWLGLLIFVCALAAYWPALSAGFIWDDNGHVTRPDLRTLEGLRRIWFEVGATQQYYPMLHSAFWFEHRLWGDNPFGYHLLNILLHATSACLFATLLRRLAIPGAAFAALLFTLHPVCVESVAWISEQKNTLSAVLYLCAALAYLRFAQSESESEGERGRAPAHCASHFPQRSKRAYALATFLFVCALLTKTVTATLPAALLVIFWWQHGRLDWRRDVLPLLPWFILGAACGLFTAHFERELIGARGADFELSAIERGLLAGRVVWFYLGKLLWPANLIFIYPRWTIDSTVWWQWFFPLAAVALLAALAWLARSRPPAAASVSEPIGSKLSTLNSQLSTPPSRRAPLAAALLFGGTLFPVLGFFNVYPFRHSYVADHFQYLASLAIFALGGAALTMATRATEPIRRIRMLLATVLLCTLAGLTFAQTRVYRDVITLYETTLARNPDSWLAHNNLAIQLADAGRFTEAISHFETALQLKPDFALAENNLGDSLVRLGRVSEAIPHFERALQLEPRYAVAHRNLGMALAMSDRTEEAVAHFAEAVRIQPTYAEAELYWAVALAQTGRPAEAIPHFERAIELAPGSAETHFAYAQALRKVGRTDEARQHFLEAQRLGDR